MRTRTILVHLKTSLLSQNGFERKLVLVRGCKKEKKKERKKENIAVAVLRSLCIYIYTRCCVKPAQEEDRKSDSTNRKSDSFGVSISLSY